MRKRPRLLFPYNGSKARMMPYIIRMLPDHAHFVEVFGGTGAGIAFKAQSTLETYNDLDPHISNVFRVITNGERVDLIRMIRDTHYKSQKLYLEAIKILRDDPMADPVRSAWAFFVVAYQGVCGHPALRGPGGFAVLRKANSQRQRWRGLPNRINYYYWRFANVQFTQFDCLEVLDRFDRPNTCFFVDPPYHPETLNTAAKHYVHEMSVEQHDHLLAALRNIKGKALLCGYHCPAYDRALADWRRLEVSTFTKLNTSATTGSPRTEVIWVNY